MPIIDTIKTEVLTELKHLSREKLYEVLDFILFIRAKDKIDISQSYFWTKKWQLMELEAEEDKKARKIIGNGSLNNLLKKLKE